MLRCSCSELRDEDENTQKLVVSWLGHSIDLQLDGSASANSWLQKNIKSMRKLSLRISAAVAPKVLQDAMKGGR